MKRAVVGAITAGALTAVGILAHLVVASRRGLQSNPTVPSQEESTSAALELLKREVELRPLKAPEDDYDGMPLTVRYRISDVEVSEAIRLCGELKVTEAIPALIRLADAPDRTAALRYSLPDGPDWGEGPTPPHLVYPAAAALVSIGEASAPDLVKALAEDPPSGRRASLLRHVLVEILGHEAAARAVTAGISKIEEQSKKECLAEHLVMLPKTTPDPGFGKPRETR